MAPPRHPRVDAAVQNMVVLKAHTPQEAMKFTGLFTQEEIQDKKNVDNIRKRAKKKYNELRAEESTLHPWEHRVVQNDPKSRSQSPIHRLSWGR
jgi:hypothetical protein